MINKGFDYQLLNTLRLFVLKRKSVFCLFISEGYAFLVNSCETLLFICLLSLKQRAQHCLCHTLNNTSKFQAWRIKMFALALHEPGVQLCRTILVGLSFSIVFSPQGMLYKGFQAPQNHLTTLTEEAGWNWVHNTQGGLLLQKTGALAHYKRN